MIKKNELVVLTKKDLISDKACLEKIKKLKNYTKKNCYVISVKDKISIVKLINSLTVKTRRLGKVNEKKWTP